MQNKLIFDIGFHKGEDTGYYLHLGYKVVGVDADPGMVEKAKEVFKKEFDSEQLIMNNFAVSDKDGETVELNISEWSYWNSLKKDIANRENKIHHTVQVPTTRLDTLMKKYGVPYYCKIDIEGYDAIAASTLRNTNYRPDFISVETECIGQDEKITEAESLRTLDTLKELGYKKFKLVDQQTLEVLSMKPFYNVEHGSDSFGKKISKLFFNEKAKVNNIELLKKEHKFNFAIYASGPFGNDLKGEWVDHPTAKKMLLMHRKDFFKNEKANNYSFWCDWHAKM